MVKCEDEASDEIHDGQSPATEGIDKCCSSQPSAYSTQLRRLDQLYGAVDQFVKAVS